MRGRTVDGVRVCNLRHRLNSAVYFTHVAYIASTSRLFLSMASIMTNNRNVLEHFGGVDANSLCRLLNNNDDNGHPDDEPNIVQMSSYYDDDSLNNLFKDKGNSFCILSLNCQSINAKFDQLNIKVQQLKSNGYEFSAICLQETWLSSDSDTSLFKIDGYNLISQGKMCSSHGGLAIYISEKFNCSTIDLNINSQIWEGQFIEIENIESNKSLIIGNVYRPPNNTNTLYQDFTNEFIPILENLQRANCETIIAGDFNIDLLKINNNATLGNYFNSVVAQSFFPLITLPTRFSDHNCTLIDNFLCKLNRSYLPSTSGILVSRISDHLPYFTFFNLLTSKRNEPSKSVKIQTWNAECIHHFQTELNNANIYELLDTTLTADPTKNLNIINNVISQAKNKHLPVFEIALVRLSETSDYLLGQVNNPLAVIRRTSGNLQQYFIVHYHFILMQS